MKRVRFRLSFKIGIAVVFAIAIIGIVLSFVISNQYRDIYIANETAIKHRNGIMTGEFVRYVFSNEEKTIPKEYDESFVYLLDHPEEAKTLAQEKIGEDGSLVKLFSDIDTRNVEDYSKLYNDLEKYPSPEYDDVRLALAILNSQSLKGVLQQKIDKDAKYEFRRYDNTGHYGGWILENSDEFGYSGGSSYNIISGESDLDELPGLKQALEEKDFEGLYSDSYVEDSDGNYYMDVYTPVFISDDYVYVFVSIKDWTSMFRSIDESVFTLVSGMVIMLSILLVIIIVLMHQIVTKKTARIRRAIIAYEDNGDVEAFNNSIKKTARGTDEINLLASELRDMAKSIDENIQERSKIAAETERQKTEMDIAASIQRGNLLSDFKAVTAGSGIELFASMTPLKEVGGDYYGCVRPDDDHIAFLIADVSDKGIPAAMFMMNSKGLIERELMDGKSPAEVLNFVNNTVAEGNDADMFVTVWLCLMTVSTGECQIVNAGHENPVIKKPNSDWQAVEYRHFLPIGAMPGLVFEEHTRKLEHGDIVFVYTDGVTDSTDPSGNHFGEDRLLRALNNISSEEPEEIIGGITKQLEEYMEGMEQFDDITMLCFRY